MEKIESVVNRFFSKLWCSQNFILHTTGVLIYDAICFVYKIIFRPSIDECLKSMDTYGNESEKKDKTQCIINIRHDWFHYGASSDQYFNYNFANLTPKKKRTYITYIDSAKYNNILNDRSAKKLFDHKYLAYKKFKKYYKRDIIKSKDINEEFLTKHPTFFFKPEDAMLGRGSRIISIDDYPDIQSMRDSVPEWDDGICEELIIEDPRMRAFHPGSVNTLRIQTLTLRDGSVRIIGAVLKMGSGQGIADNTARGGIVADVDLKRGVVVSDGVDNWRHVYQIHPDTGVKIKGFVLPEWGEACQMAEEIAKSIPQVRYISLDLALTKDGWAMVEGNAQGAFLRQICNKRGYRKEWEILIRS